MWAERRRKGVAVDVVALATTVRRSRACASDWEGSSAGEEQQTAVAPVAEAGHHTVAAVVEVRMSALTIAAMVWGSRHAEGRMSLLGPLLAVMGRRTWSELPEETEAEVDSSFAGELGTFTCQFCYPRALRYAGHPYLELQHQAEGDNTKQT